VRSPIKITGTFLNPKVSPKATPIAARAIGGILLAFVNPLAAILPFLDPGKVGDAELTCDDTLQNLRKNVKVPNKDKEAQEAKQDDEARDRKAQAEKNAEVHQTQINEVR
jgi:hypothetical protein